MSGKRVARSIRPTAEMLRTADWAHTEAFKQRAKQFRQLGMPICYTCGNPFCICGLEKSHKTYQIRMQSNDEAQHKLDAFEAKEAALFHERIKELV